MLAQGIIWFAVIALLMYLFAKIIRNIFGVENVKKKKGFINDRHKFGSRIIFFIFNSIIIIYTFSEFQLNIFILLNALEYVVYLGFTAYIQWEFFSDSKEYLVTSLSAFYLLILLGVSIPYLEQLT
ncbi:hypothetical protein HNQ94_001107 [Salirhabdus euzebyi]|uniref:DUF4181 domain-containing protein n=1 Tax=Salirhabdus euzebyi TaxID=394506 RepID=A0A841PZA7_9BACI|nr:DUF4181 domain-containing protein [Salirhabdus euzebyi]MBB6452661.1 hypothetical protein [Salirhabdus euzebyi]